ncbi:MAG: tripartite tricarboxylate transporter substrate binding protein [Variibacter sp.]|nr:tripartite tricarboxylate transporter substrate binding protein [Variibacter sp.]
MARASLRFVWMLLAAAIAACPARAETYPERTIRMIVPFSAGGPIDLLGRPLADKLSTLLGQPVVVDNRPGANGIIGTVAVAKSEPDGYTMLMTTGSFTANAFTAANLPYDPLKDFAPITQIARSYGITFLVSPSFPAKSVAELVELAKKEPGKLSYAHAGIGNATHIAAELFQKAAGIKLLAVPYKGAGSFLSDIVSGQVNMGFTSTVAAVPYVRSGQLRALATTGTKRAPSLPEVPSFDELGYKKAVLVGYFGLWFPAGTAPERIERVHRAVAEALRTPEMQAVIDKSGIEAVGSGPEEFARFLAEDYAMNAELLPSIGVTPK